ncbi:MFS transporter [Herbaspirillum sp. RTI4]|uniref:MFS transporter n=1 Tax=Herbaspirillum sp. RTI4 TaxID=3048640 RepID=UPI002AB363A3|nr:MFS transporter [Herbaspirillum sp. RTI4]MDY7577773.1 MFS transporter [Herbaspirillum sp. RTI4]MEA9980799.1 MFS transporter [Herbaspirillum sp. RTI4]
MTSTTTDHQAGVRWLPYLVAATFFMEYLDTTVIATALPQMSRSFGVGPNALSIGMTAYMLALAVFIPVSGWIADRYGSRTVFGGAIVVFTVASILCGFSHNLTEFTAARVLQGIGGAMMVPVGRLIVVRNTEKSQLMQAISTITWPAIVAPVVGPPIGGFIVTYASWRWIFFLNIPFGIAALIAVGILVRNQRGEVRKPLDLVGFFLSGGALTGILYGTELASLPGADLGLALAYVAAGIVLGACAYHHAKHRAHPLIDYSTLKIPTYSVTVLTGSVARIGIGAVPYLMPLLFQIGFGLSAFHSGLLLLASALGNLGMKALVSPFLKRYGFKTACIAAASVAGIFTLACGWLSPATPLPLIVLVVFVYGVARSMQFSTLATLAYADIPPSLMSTASTLWSAAAQMTIGMGIAFGALSLNIAEHLRGDAAGAGGTHYLLADFRWAFTFAAIVTFLSLIGYLGMSRDAGIQLGGAGKSRA